MDTASRALYSKHPSSAETGGMADAQAHAKSWLGMGEWKPTVVNPSKEGGFIDRAKAGLHIAVWVATLILSCMTNFMSKGSLKDPMNPAPVSNPACYHVDATLNTCYTGMSDTAWIIAILSAICTIVGVVSLVASAAWFPADDYAKMPMVNLVVTFFTTSGCVGGYYILSLAAAQTSQTFYILALITTIVQTYAQILLYATSATLEVGGLPRALLPSIGIAVQFISALSISSGDFKNAAWYNFTQDQKRIAFLVPALMLTGLLIMYVTRTWLDMKIEKVGDKPFIRSIILSTFFGAAILSVYKLSYLTVNNSDPTAYIFAVTGAAFDFLIVGLVFLPTPAWFGMK